MGVIANGAAMGKYETLSLLPAGSGAWIENCRHCHIPMKTIIIQTGTKLEGIPGQQSGIPDDEKYHPVGLKAWLENPVIQPGGQFWYCDKCESVWVIALGFWTKVRVNGEDKVYANRFPEEVKKVVEEQIDPGPKLSPDATMCPECHVWRMVKPYEDRTIHVCPKCRTGQIMDKVESKEETSNAVLLQHVDPTELKRVS